LDLSLLSAIQHPLTAVATSAQLLEEDLEELSVEEIRARIAGMHRDTFRLHELVENFLSAAMIRAGRLTVHPQSMRIEDVVEEISPVIASVLDQRGHRLEVFGDDWTPEVLADGRRIGQVLLNLISNASSHSPEGAAIEVDIALRGELVRVSFADRGTARDADTETRIVEVYAGRGPIDVRDMSELPIAVARWIIEAHGGKVGARIRPGGGARFWFELPAMVSGRTLSGGRHLLDRV